MQAWEIVSWVLFLFYLGLIGTFVYGWLSIPRFLISEIQSDFIRFDVIVPMRNEENQVRRLLENFMRLDYPRSAFSITLINDHSSDATEEEIKKYIAHFPEFPFRLINVEEIQGLGSKKAAISYGISKSEADWIVLTDADCSHNANWLKTLSAFIIQKKAKMVYAPVMFASENVFQHMQALEFAGLLGIGASAIQLKNPNMCSAANLSFEKSVFTEVGGYLDKMHVASGDDEFLLHKVFKRYPNQVHFLKNNEALVTTDANSTLRQLSDQRRRWVSKSTHYDNRYITAILVGAYLFNFSILFNLISGLFNPDLFRIGLIQLAGKAAIEFSILFPVLRFLNRPILIVYLLLAEPFHILYVLVIGIWANLGAYNWKGRQQK